jgi:hypothetical protein
MTQSNNYCLYCERDSSQVPLMALVFQGQDLLAQISPAEQHHHD